jgi:phage terminase large subunit-like protein
MKNRVLWDTLIYGGASRRQPLMLSISTAGVYDVATIGWEQYSYARGVLNGTNDKDWAFFALIYEAEKDDDWTSEDVWKKANPSYGVTVKIDALREECVEAKAEPRKQNSFRRYRLNQWVQQATRWIPLHKWDKNHVHPVTREALLGAVAFGGLDIGSVDDLTAFALLCECPLHDGCWDVLPRFWCPETAITDQHNRNAGLYQQWAEAGLLTVTPGPSTDYDFVEADILKDAKEFDLRVVGIDRLFQGQQVQNHLSAEGVDVVPIGQGFLGQGAPMKEFERLWLNHSIHHGGHPILRWMADHVEVKQDPAGNLKIVKPNSKHDPRKVDGIQAIVNAIDPITRQQPPAQPEYQFMVFGGAR